LEQSIKTILSTIDDAIAQFQDTIPGIQKLVYEELQPIVKELQVKNGKLLNNIENLKLIGTLQNKLEKIIISAEYKKSVQSFIDSFTTVSNLNNEYFSQFNKKYKPKNTLPIIKQLAVESTINDLVGQGLSSNIIAPIQKILQQNITTGGSYAKFQEQLQNHILQNETGEGNLQRYTKQITTDAINQYNAQYSETVAQDLQFNWGRYVGSNITTTREFCTLLTEKQWVHKSELPEIIKGHIDGTDCKLSKTTGLPLGIIPDTNADNFKVRRGGYNCGHQFFWVPDSIVPLDIKAMFENKGKFIVTTADVKELNNSSVFTSAFAEFESEMKLFKTTGQTSSIVDISGIVKNNLSHEEAKLIFAYTTHAHDEINTELYLGNPSPAISKFEGLLNDVLEKMPIHTGTVLRDYTPRIPVQEYLKEFSELVGTEKLKVFKGFLSTSKNPRHDWGSKVKFNIQSKTGRLIENISSHAPEQEVLFQSMSAFKVTKVDGNTIYLEEF
jgi:hypothetical protein